MDSKKIRHQNLLLLLECYRTQKEFAVALGVSIQRSLQLIKGKLLGDATARQIERIHDLPPGWMDVPHDAIDADPPFDLLPLTDDQWQLLADYDQLSPIYQRLAREAVTAFLALERSRLAKVVPRSLQPES